MFNSVIFWVCKGVFRNLSDLQFIQQEVCSLLRVLYILDWTVWGFELLAGHLELKKRGFFAGWPVKKDLIQLQEEPLAATLAGGRSALDYFQERKHISLS